MRSIESRLRALEQARPQRPTLAITPEARAVAMAELDDWRRVKVAEAACVGITLQPPGYEGLTDGR